MLEDEYEHTCDSVEYVLENVLMPDEGTEEFKLLRDQYNSQLIQPCKCNGANECCDEKQKCLHGGNYGYFENKELVVRNGFVPTIVECSDLCDCPTGCCNRLVQLGPRKMLDIFQSSRYRSKGLRTTANIPRGGFICEYAGELLTSTEAERRFRVNDHLNNMNYIFCLNEYAQSSGDSTEESFVQIQTTIVDPSQRGNIGRYLNHSCEPNCEIKTVRVNSPLPKIAIFAKRDIAANEELCFHYGGEKNNCKNETITAKTCLCGSQKCEGIMPNIRA